ncbi:MAG: pseudaminic acid biosynthesis-associated methylase [Flavobacteriaceae bacterium]|jgi:pseudaminic acid biosynthesis-associated methylase|nr:pseudaminic acid biosynthesis-associated methylase [Flavobacteriaceae bacterium]
MNFKTKQEDFWAGDFGDNYIDRNRSAEYLAANTALFSEIFKSTIDVTSAIEFGANVGLSLEAIRRLMPKISLSAIEINTNAVKELKKIENLEVFNTSILNFSPKKAIDFVLIKGVLIHIDPDELQNVYDILYHTSAKYICIAEYYNPTPIVLKYRGHDGKLFKRDFAGEMMDKFPNLKLVDYGFFYHRDYNFPHDDTNWFLLKKC